MQRRKYQPKIQISAAEFEGLFFDNLLMRKLGAKAVADGKPASEVLDGDPNTFWCSADAKGNGPMAPEGTHPSNLTDDKWERGSTDGEIFMVIRDGAGPKFDMKGNKSKMSDTDIWNVVNYLRSLQSK